MNVPKPGEKLVNGRELVAIRLLGRKQPDWAGDLYAVLALTGMADHYAVWYYIHVLDDSDGTSHCYEGFYTGDFRKAVADWEARHEPGAVPS